MLRLLILLILQGLVPWTIARANVDFDRDVRPILSEHCYACHGPDAQHREADLRLDEPTDLQRVTQDHLESELQLRVDSKDPDLVMPPPATKNPLSSKQRQTLSDWIAAGAPFQKHWAFRSPSRPSVPISDSDKGTAWVSNPIDAFVLDRLEEQGLDPSGPANPETLLRRITVDLTGMPPTPAELDSFLRDHRRSPSNAVNRLITRLMASPSYSEHMAVAWLEASRYADTDGYQNDRYRYQHAWRDWVLDAYRNHMPYDQFVIEQLAGDLLPDATLRQQIATGFGRNHRINSEDGSIPEEWRNEYVSDRVDTFGTIFLGLTLGCARCHDHKFDPISQREYYQLYAYFNSISEWGVGPNNGNSPPFVEVPESWPQLSDSENQFVQPDPVKLRRAREADGNGLKRPQAGDPNTVMVMHELAEKRPTYVLHRGLYDQPGDEALQPGVPQSIDRLTESSGSPADRLGLAQWLFHPEHPLTARVAVNRIWQHFFGVGLVASPDNFGIQGSRPTHPELLDWLATEFIRSGWNVQEIQRLILTSSTYAQRSLIDETQRAMDPANRWLSRGPRVRMTAFMLRDQSLSASGLLVNQWGGPPAKPYMPPKIWSAISNNKYVQDKGSNLFRRSVYTYWRRTIPPPTMMNFNAAAREVCTVARTATNTPLQALTLMNNKTFVEAAKWLARRMTHESDQPLVHGFRLVLARQPSESELTVLRTTLEGFRETFRQDHESARQLLEFGEANMPASDSVRDTNDVVEQAAMTMMASLIMNTDEAVTRE